MKIEYLSRAEWGSLTSTELFVANRFSATQSEKTTIQVHHTASIDKLDTTPNRWTKARAIAYMKALQWVRPELGPLPYSINFAASEDLDTVWVFEGRGVLTVGAHTAGHNRDGVGMGVFGNFDIADPEAAAVLMAAIEIVSSALRYGDVPLGPGLEPVEWLEYPLPNLGSVPNSKGWTAWGHRDSSPKSCPGNTLYPLLEHFTLEDDMATPKNWDKDDWELISHYTNPLIGTGEKRRRVSVAVAATEGLAAATLAAVQAHEAGTVVDPGQIAALVLAGLSPTVIADSVAEDIVEAVRDELNRRLEA